MSLFRRQKARKVSSLNTLRNRKLRIESLEQKNLLAGDVMATLEGGNLVLSGDSDVDGFRVLVTRDENATNPGLGEVSLKGLINTGTTVNGSALPESFVVTGDVIVRFGLGGDNGVFFGESGMPTTEKLELPGSIIVEGRDGADFFSFSNLIVDSDISMEGSTGLNESSFSFNDSTVHGDVRLEASNEFSGISLNRSRVDGDVTLISEGVGIVQSFVGIRDSSVGDDVRSVSDAALAETRLDGATIGDDVLLHSGAGDDIVFVGQGNSMVPFTTIGDDLRIYSGGGDDEIILADFVIGDDLVFRGGEGDDILEIDIQNVDNTRNVVGDDLYATGGDGIDDIKVSQIDIDDKLRVSAGAGDDVVTVEILSVGRSALVSLGSGVDYAEVSELTGARSLTVLGRGENSIFISDTTTSHFVTVLTSSGVDTVDLFNVNTYSAWIATKAGDDVVSIADSTFDYLFVLLGSGDDMLTLNGVTVDRLAVLSGGSGTNDQLIDDGDNEINFAIDFAFESGMI